MTIVIDVTIRETTTSYQRAAYALHVDGRPAADAEALWQVGAEPDLLKAGAAMPG